MMENLLLVIFFMSTLDTLLRNVQNSSVLMWKKSNFNSRTLLIATFWNEKLKLVIIFFEISSLSDSVYANNVFFRDL